MWSCEETAVKTPSVVFFITILDELEILDFFVDFDLKQKKICSNKTYLLTLIIQKDYIGTLMKVAEQIFRQVPKVTALSPLPLCCINLI